MSQQNHCFKAALILAISVFASTSQAEKLFESTDVFTADNNIQLVGCETEIGCGCSTTACDSVASCSSCTAGCDSCCGCGDWLTRFIKQSDTCYDEFISPMTNPVYFEDPRNLTEARVIFIHHQVPGAAGGGDVQLFAVQLRAALTDRLSLIATKDGYITSSNPLIDDGWADLNLGLKYNLYCDPCSQTIVSAGARFELPSIGSSQALQGNGSGLFDIFLSAGTELGCGYHYLTATGVLLPTDTSAESQMFFWSHHLDRRIGCSNFYWLAESNWYHYLKSGSGGINGTEGGDLFNLGSTGVAGSDIVTGALGMKYKPSRNIEAGLAWEAPLTNNKDVLENRLTLDMIFRY